MIQLIPDVNTVSTIVFSTDGRSLQTDAGVFLLESSVSSLPADSSARTTSLELRDDWIRNQDEDLLWLPHEYRGRCSAIRRQTLVIGQKSGAVSIFSLR
nr:hypothetical protein CFP56_79114 [Quercus suber]